MKRATSDIADTKRQRSYFNPRPHEEGDQQAQSLQSILKYFNPRPHEEGDLKPYAKNTKKHDISIHALMKRATR